MDHPISPLPDCVAPEQASADHRIHIVTVPCKGENRESIGNGSSNREFVSEIQGTWPGPCNHEWIGKNHAPSTKTANCAPAATVSYLQRDAARVGSVRAGNSGDRQSVVRQSPGPCEASTTAPMRSSAADTDPRRRSLTVAYLRLWVRASIVWPGLVMFDLGEDPVSVIKRHLTLMRNRAERDAPDRIAAWLRAAGARRVFLRSRARTTLHQLRVARELAWEMVRIAREQRS